MKYKPELGIWGNLERAFSELTNTNNTMRNNKTEQEDTNALTLEIAADHEARLCEIELGV